ncbi:MAG: hypothetical protein V3V62_01005 [bacterium]
MTAAPALLLLVLLAGCAGSAPAPAARAFPLPARPPSAGLPPERHPLLPLDVIAGLLPGEGAPRVCFLPGQWQKVLAYMVEVEARARRESLRLGGHIEKLEKQIREMNRYLGGSTGSPPR